MARKTIANVYWSGETWGWVVDRPDEKYRQEQYETILLAYLGAKAKLKELGDDAQVQIHAQYYLREFYKK